VGVINASPLAMGALNSRGAPSWHPAPASVLERCAAAAELCRAHGTDLAKLALQYAVTTGGWATTVVGSTDPDNIRRNIRWIQEPLDTELLAEVALCLAPARDQGWVNGKPENQCPSGQP
jgi:L-galactose dehydrogenase